MLAVDSVQTLHLADVAGVAPGLGRPGARGRRRGCSHYAKTKDVPTILVGHVTKDGALAGPRVLEHLVDTVLYFEGDRGHAYRILRAHKNRFGSTNEIGVFEMRGRGLREVPDPSALFLAERPLGAPGSAVVAALEGSRPDPRRDPGAGRARGVACRGARRIGIDANRVSLLSAVLERRAGVDLVGCDVFVNVAGGAASEPAADLGVLAAVVSSARGRSTRAPSCLARSGSPARCARSVSRSCDWRKRSSASAARCCRQSTSRAQGCRHRAGPGVADVASALAALLG